MGRKQIAVLRTLSKLKKPVSVAELAEKGIQAEGKSESYDASDLRSAFRRLSARNLVTVSKETRGEGDKAKEVDVAIITADGRQALKDLDNPPVKETKSKAKKNDAEVAQPEDEADADAADEDAASVV